MKWFWSGGPDNRKDESASKFPCPIYLQLLSVASLVSAHSFASFPQCEHDFQPGNCSGKVERYTYDKTSRKCVLKEFSSCPGNDNHFWWKTDCQDRCETDEGDSPNHLKSSVEDLTTWESFTSFSFK
ncbi:Uncharacterised protein r2_g1502 [Pycnogonum litorale]